MLKTYCYAQSIDIFEFNFIILWVGRIFMQNNNLKNTFHQLFNVCSQ